MALVKCVECGKEISDLAEFCPHCGRPTERRPKPVSYLLKKGTGTQNRFASFLKNGAIVVLIAGLIIAIAAANVEKVEVGRYSSRTVTEFSFSIFITTFLTYIESAFVLWSLGSVVQMIQETRDMVSGMQLERAEETPAPPLQPVVSPEKQKRAEAKKRREELEQLEEAVASGEIPPIQDFLPELYACTSMKEIWEKWQDSPYAEYYPEIDKFLEEKKEIERIYGNNSFGINLILFKKLISKTFKLSEE